MVLPSGRPIGHNQVGCSEEQKLAYVVSNAGAIYSFDPQHLKFEKKGVLDCPSGGARPYAMSVDRKGTAWISYTDGALFTASTKDAKCQATSWKKGQQGLDQFTLAWLSTRKDARDEQLYIGASGPNRAPLGLWKADPKLAITKVGNYTNGMEKRLPDLAGDGEGRLYGFFAGSPPMFGEIDENTGATPKTEKIEGVDLTSGSWALAAWGGDVWLFHAGGNERGSHVTRVRRSGDGGHSEVVKDVGGFQIVGAGVSTCAPLAPP